MHSINEERALAVRNQVIGGRTVAEWDKLWQPVPNWQTVNTTKLQVARGIVRMSMRGEVKAIMRASDNRRGIVKKFGDLTRPSPSSRDHHAGRLIYENRDDLDADIIITGERRDMEAVNIALKRALIELYRPAWLGTPIV